MTAALLTGGLLAPHGATGGATGPSGVICAFALRDDDGALQAGVDLTAATKRVSTDGGVTWAGAAGATPVSREDGLYTYTFDDTETATPYVLFKLVFAGYQTVIERVEVSSPDLDAAVIDIENAINAGFGAVEGDVISLGATVNAHTDSVGAATNAHTDSALAAQTTTIQAAITNSEAATATLVNAHTDSVVGDAEDAIAAVHAAVDALPNTLLDTQAFPALSTVTVRELFAGLFSVVLGNATGLETPIEQYLGPDNSTLIVKGTVDESGNRTVTLSFPPLA